ncbi:hypothetical protein ALO86_102216 [Pseudomonas syringae pv. berberidis]|uniref:Uncharacterized protein n=1 Tax=Pseudomonas syringae pv. spinaceae TaxID=264459 RepID=A0A0Q0CE86_PSESX|nr:hypothetical protein ALO86_102216 [Pseudomonas syringae pv. berberidis]KPY86119.1 Unknown protein sequence [Pseudomonas syringae pv. spinaceae]RMV65223.1 hypothetical protein ALP06_101855 [Pseudomonas coronafaciens pv. atropurpurea]RMP63005.1 hypothetical protein ALQ19_102536 [Pseudomonas syringae pv. berberidis]RMQ44264.1 hypothetical protein ALQ06_102441 [Pseudomonas syringae pv. berberidis]
MISMFRSNMMTNMNIKGAAYTGADRYGRDKIPALKVIFDMYRIEENVAILEIFAAESDIRLAIIAAHF